MKAKKLNIFQVLLLAASLALAGSCVAHSKEAKGPNPAPETPPKSMLQFIFQDQAFSFQLVRTVAVASYGGSDLGECLTTAYRIIEGDYESWFKEWDKTAAKVFTRGEQCLAEGRNISARDEYLRACNYYRISEFFLHGNIDDPRIYQNSAKAVAAFTKAMPFFTHPAEAVLIPYQGTTLPGYFFQVDNSGKPRPTLIVQTGYDGSQEELYFTAAIAALRRGYNVLTFEGPGQGQALREQKLYFRHDWEKVITPVVDYCLTRPEIDPHKIALYGISMGGYFAPRGAAFEHRLAAVIADGGVYAPRLGIGAFYMGPEQGLDAEQKTQRVLAEIGQDADNFNQEVEAIMASSNYLRWFMENGMFTFNADTPAKFIQKLAELTLQDGIAEQITCPVLVLDSDQDTNGKGQAQMLYDHLTCPKSFYLFKDEDGAGLHCQVGATIYANQVIFDWLDKTLNK